MKDGILLGIIIVNYKSYQETINYIKNELGKILLHKKIAIVTNDFDTTEVALMAEELNAFTVRSDKKTDLNSEIYLINSKENLGFAKGNNLGTNFLVENFNPKYLLFSNNDIELISENICENLIGKLEKMPNIGIIGPSIISHDKYGQVIDGSPNPEYISAIRFLQRHLLYPIHHALITFNQKIINKNCEKALEKEEGERYWVSGCFMLVKTSKFILAGMFDPNTFLYAEEMILSERFNKIGYKMYYYPGVKIFHSEHGTTSKYLDSIKRSRFVFDSMTYYYTSYIVKNRCLKPLFKFTNFIFHHIYYPLYFRNKILQ